MSYATAEAASLNDDNPQGEWVGNILDTDRKVVIAGLYSIGEVEEWSKASDRAETLLLMYAENNWKNRDSSMDVDGFLSDLSINLKDAESFAAFLDSVGMFDSMSDDEASVFNYAGEGIYAIHQRMAKRAKAETVSNVFDGLLRSIGGKAHADVLSGMAAKLVRS